jgi:hypothetical protein
MTIVDEQQQPTPPTLETLQKKIDEFANGIRGIRDIIWDRKKTIIRQMDEIRQLASDLNIDNIQLRKMILESFADIDVSESWLRKLLPETLKLSKHTRKDYLKLQQQRDQQPLQQQKQQEEKFTAVGYLEIQKNDIPVKVTVNVKTKSIEWMEIY